MRQFFIPKFECQTIAEDTIRLVKYKEQPIQTEFLRWRKGYASQTHYELFVDLPPERKIEIVVIVKQTSSNNYFVVISTPTEARVSNHRTQGEVVTALASLGKG
jgi:hypothetical protein